MATSIQALREERKKLASAMRNHYDKFEGDNAKNWDKAAQETYDNYARQIADLDSQIERLQQVLDVEASDVSAIRRLADQNGVSEDEQRAQNELGKSALMAFLRGGIEALSQEQRVLLNERRRMNNAMSTAVGAEGGYLTQNEFAPFLSEAMRAIGGMRSFSTVIQTATGSQMDFPTADATTEEGEIVGENASVSSSDTTFGTKSIDTYKYSSKSIAVPFELLQDSHFDLDSYIKNLLALRIWRITNKHHTIGSGTGQPGGMVTSAVVGKVGTSAVAITLNDLIDLEHSVDPVYRSNKASFMFNDLTLAELKKLKDSTGRPLWMPGVASSEPDRILNRPYAINQHMPVMAANARSVAFGDFSKYIIRDVMQVQLFRMTDSKYTEKGQVGFLAFMRCGGNMIDVGGAVKTFRNAAA